MKKQSRRQDAKIKQQLAEISEHFSDIQLLVFVNEIEHGTKPSDTPDFHFKNLYLHNLAKFLAEHTIMVEANGPGSFLARDLTFRQKGELKFDLTVTDQPDLNSVEVVLSSRRMITQDAIPEISPLLNQINETSGPYKLFVRSTDGSLSGSIYLTNYQLRQMGCDFHDLVFDMVIFAIMAMEDLDKIS